MFNRKKDLPSPKPDPPTLLYGFLILLICVCTYGFSLTVFILNSINENLRHEETNQGYTIPQVPISPYPN